MSIDTVFKPQGPNTLVVAAGIQIPNGGSGVTSFRVRNLAAVAQYFGWGQNAAAAVTAASTPPSAGNPVVNQAGMLPTSVETFEIPGNMFFAASSATGFEFIAGQGS
jgi:hypothetical protein